MSANLFRLYNTDEARKPILRRLPVGEVSFEAVVDYVDTRGRAQWFAETLQSGPAAVMDRVRGSMGKRWILRPRCIVLQDLN